MKHLVFVDDEDFFLNLWKSFAEQLTIPHQVYAFHSIRDFFLFCSENRNLVEKFNVVVVDRFSHRFDALKGCFASDFRQSFPDFTGQLILCSALESHIEQLPNGYDLFLSKEDMSLEQLEGWL